MNPRISFARTWTRAAAGAALLLVVFSLDPGRLAVQDAHAQAGQSGGTSAFSLQSPHKSLGKTQQLMNTVAVKVLLLLDYTEYAADAGAWKTRDMPGIAAARYFSKPASNGVYRTVEIAVIPHTTGGYEFYIYGLETDANGLQQPNPDLTYIQASMQYEVQTIQVQLDSPGADQLSYQVYHLSYIQSDRALAMLKSLGYTTVEYAQQAGETVYDRIYAPVQNGEWRLPVVIKFIDATKTSLMDPSPSGYAQTQAYGQTYGSTATTDLGGTFLHQMTSGEPQQRFLIVYNKNNPEPMEGLLNLLREKIDLPARQLVIEALVIEVNTDRLKELGLEMGASKNRFGTSFDEPNAQGERQPFTFTFGQNKTSTFTDAYGNVTSSIANAFADVFSFRTTLRAMIEDGDAEVLSSPSVLVLNGRQARIQIGQQVPVSKSVGTTTGYAAGVEYIQTGIVLNLRPRVSEDGSEVTMQIETIVSAVNEALSIEKIGEGQVLLAPRVDNRQVQSFVRVADNTPFIIGGLVQTDQRERTVGIPILSRIPILGLPFRRKTTDTIKKEVIVVLTPHVAPIDEKSFSYVIPKDSGMFDSFGNTLFRNAYRIRDDDVFDLRFVFDSEVFKDLLSSIRKKGEEDLGLRNQEPYASLLDGAVPGEEILVRRMLWELVFDKSKTDFARHIDVKRLILMEDRPSAPDSSGFQITFLHNLMAAREREERNALVLAFDARPRGTLEHPFVPPKAEIRYEEMDLSPDGYIGSLMRANRRLPDGSPNRWTILLADVRPRGVRGATALEVLQGVMVLKRVLALNKTLPLTIREFRVGRQIIFPTEEDLRKRFHIIDRDAAQFFYEAVQYYPEFEKAFSLETRRVIELLDGSAF